MKNTTKICMLVATVFLVACGTETEAIPVEPRATFELDRVYADGVMNFSDHMPVNIRFIGPENGGTVLMAFGDQTIQAGINPSRDHPSFEAGYWHHHLYAGSTATGSPRINFMELLPDFGIDDNPDATDNTQSSYQRGNLHYVVETGEFRLRLTRNGVVWDYFFREKVG